MDPEQHIPPAMRDLFERFLALPTSSLDEALSGAADLVTEVFKADKVDGFVFDASRNSLVAHGTSSQPLSQLQKQQGLDVLAVANGGICVRVFQTEQSFVSGRLRDDNDELPGIREVLLVQSQIAVPIRIGHRVAGVLCVASQQPNMWGPSDVRLTEALAHWVGIVSHRAQLVAETERRALDEGRRAAGEELITVLAHDLRNFVAPVQLRLQALRRRAMREGRNVDLHDIEPALRSVARIGGLVNDLLDVARLDHGLFSLELEPVDVTALVHEIADGLSTPECEVRVRSYGTITAEVDVQRIRQGLENLIANAVKHSPPGCEVIVSVRRVASKDGPRAQVTIHDQGAGIPAHLLPRIFDRFFTSEQTRGTGLGLGLFLAKSIAQLHQGDLKVTSNAGEGTSFMLSVPCLASDSEVPSAPSQQH